MRRRKVKENWKYVREKSSIMGNVILESITNVRTIRAFSKEDENYNKNLNFYQHQIQCMTMTNFLHFLLLNARVVNNQCVFLAVSVVKAILPEAGHIDASFARSFNKLRVA